MMPQNGLTKEKEALRAEVLMQKGTLVKCFDNL
jgi:hypothetical protein